MLRLKRETNLNRVSCVTERKDVSLKKTKVNFETGVMWSPSKFLNPLELKKQEESVKK